MQRDGTQLQTTCSEPERWPLGACLDHQQSALSHLVALESRRS